MIEYYNKIFENFKQYITDISKYSPRVVKYNTNTSTYFPIVTCVLSNLTATSDITLCKFEHYEQYYFTIEVYTKNIIEDSKTIASQEVNDELSNLVLKFFENYNMKLTMCSYTPNIDQEILRRTIRFQCMINNNGNIIRR